MFVSLFGTGVLVAPSWALEAGRELPDSELASHAKLLELSTPYGGRALGVAKLYFSDSAPSLPNPNPNAELSRARTDAVDLETACPDEDTAEVGLSEMENTFILLSESERDSLPVAGAGYDVWEEKLAHLGALVAPTNRRSGLGFQSVAFAQKHAMDAGLSPQWRVHVDNAASIRTALRAGFKYAGTQTTVILKN
ncbi:hypothetical protein D3C74_300270 [compost metagenome]